MSAPGRPAEAVVLVGAAVACGLLTRRSPALGVAAALAALLAALSNVPEVKEEFLQLRWAALAGLGGALLLPLVRRRPLVAALTVATSAVAVASTVWSVEPSLTAQRAIAYAATLVVAFAVATAAAEPVGRRRVVLASAVTLCAAIALSLGLLAVDPARARFGDTLQGIFENPNALGLTAALAAPLVLGASEGGRAKSVGGFAAIAVLVLVILGSGTRTALAAFALAIVVYALCRRRPLLAASPLVAGIAAIGVFWLGGVTGKVVPESLRISDPWDIAQLGVEAVEPHDLGTAPSVWDTRSALSRLSGARDESWAAAADLAAERPVVGYGFGVGDRLFERYAVDFVFYLGADPGSSYLRIALELGLLGVVLLAPLALALAFAVRAASRATLEPSLAALAALLVAAVAAAALESFLSAPGTPWFLLTWLPAALFLLGRGSDDAEGSDRSPTAARSRSAADATPRLRNRPRNAAPL